MSGLLVRAAGRVFGGSAKSGATVLSGGDHYAVQRVSQWSAVTSVVFEWRRCSGTVTADGNNTGFLPEQEVTDRILNVVSNFEKVSYSSFFLLS